MLLKANDTHSWDLQLNSNLQEFFLLAGVYSTRVAVPQFTGVFRLDFGSYSPLLRERWGVFPGFNRGGTEKDRKRW